MIINWTLGKLVAMKQIRFYRLHTGTKGVNTTAGYPGNSVRELQRIAFILGLSLPGDPTHIIYSGNLRLVIRTLTIVLAPSLSREEMKKFLPCWTSSWNYSYTNP
jgi:hypothetical protein